MGLSGTDCKNNTRNNTTSLKQSQKPLTNIVRPDKKILKKKLLPATEK
jgi:hypothetical protein